MSTIVLFSVTLIVTQQKCVLSRMGQSCVILTIYPFTDVIRLEGGKGHISVLARFVLFYKGHGIAFSFVFSSFKFENAINKVKVFK